MPRYYVTLEVRLNAESPKIAQNMVADALAFVGMEVLIGDVEEEKPMDGMKPHYEERWRPTLAVNDGHGIVRCQDCKTILRQCRCPGPREVKYVPGPCVNCSTLLPHLKEQPR